MLPGFRPIVDKQNLRANARLPPSARTIAARTIAAVCQEKMFQPCALGISHDEQKINPRIIILH